MRALTCTPVEHDGLIFSCRRLYTSAVLLYRPQRLCLFLLSGVAAKHAAQYSTSQSPAKSPGENGATSASDVVLHRSASPCFTARPQQPLHCSAPPPPPPPAEETQLWLTMHKRTRCPCTTCNRWIHLRIFLEVKLSSSQERPTVRLE